MSSIRGDRTRHVVTHNPNSVNPGEEPYVDIPKMKGLSCLFPGSLHLVFDIEVTGYVYPNIDEVKVTIEGVPNVVYSQGVPKSRLYGKACRLFSQGVRDQFMTLEKFFKDKFTLVIDLRSNADREKTGHGKLIINTQNGVLL